LTPIWPDAVGMTPFALGEFSIFWQYDCWASKTVIRLDNHMVKIGLMEILLVKKEHILKVVCSTLYPSHFIIHVAVS
jgi:hypothetical protein